MTVELARPIPVRLPTDVVRRLEDESRRDGIPVSALIRRSVMRDYFVGGDSTNPPDNTTLTQRPLSPDPECVVCFGRGIIRRDGTVYVCSCSDVRDTSLDPRRLVEEAEA